MRHIEARAFRIGPEPMRFAPVAEHMPNHLAAAGRGCAIDDGEPARSDVPGPAVVDAGETHIDGFATLIFNELDVVRPRIFAERHGVYRSRVPADRPGGNCVSDLVRK